MIKLFGVSKSYGPEAPTLDGLSLEIEKGEFVWLTGPSGAGKSTLLKLLFCAEAPTSGQIIVGGRNVARLGQSGVPLLRRSIGVVFQDFKLLPNRTVLENVGFALEVLGFSDREIEERSIRRLDQVGLRHKARSLPQKLSGGEQQRRLVGERAGDGDALLFAARKLLRVMVEPVRQPHRLEHFDCTGDSFPAPPAQQPQHEADIFQHRALFQQLEILEHHPDRAAEFRDAGDRQDIDIFAAHQDVAAGRALLAKQQPQQRRLARPRTAGEKTKLPALHLERDVRQREGVAVVGFVHMVKADHSGELFGICGGEENH